MHNKTALITGGAKRIGAEIARMLHAEGMNICIHYRLSENEARQLCDQLNRLRDNSAILVQADLLHIAELPALVEKPVAHWGGLDALINNASTFYPTPVGTITEDQWEDLTGSNLKVPLFLSQAAAPYLKQSSGNIINIVDVHGFRPMKNHTVYCVAKAGLMMLTQSLAKELGPEVRVNGIAPGAIMWPENNLEQDDALREMILDRTALKRQGDPRDIAATVRFLIRDASYITGQVIPVCGGRSINI
ncbi:MAG: pteridine reductase [Pseudomonadota bacterium]|nr:pteridine reductase [Pseudomonadota bacterium]